MKRKLIFGGVATLIIAILISWGLLWSRDRKIAELEASAVTTALQGDEWLEAQEVKDKALGTLTAELRALLEEVKEAGARSLLEADITSESVTASVPVFTTRSLGGEDIRATEFSLSARYSGLVAANGRGGIFAKGKFHIDLNGDDWSRTYTLDIDESNSSFRAGRTLAAALQYYDDRPSKFAWRLRQPRHWRFGLVAGGGLCLDAQGYAVTLCGYAGYGVQF